MNRRTFHIGPGAASLMLIAVVLGMSVLGMLSMINARSDMQLVERSKNVIAETARMNASAESRFADLDALVLRTEGMPSEEAMRFLEENLPEGMALDGDTVSWKEVSEDGRSLMCAVRIHGEAAQPRLSWVEYSIFSETEAADFETEEMEFRLWY